MTSLKGRVCVVTGGGQGIGEAIAQAFGAEGARLAILDRDGGVGEETTRRLAGEGADARFYQVDVTDEAGVTDVAERVAADFGGMDVLVNNAGISRIGPSMTLPLDDWTASLDVMATGVFLCSREFGRALRAHGGGAIVNISSINGLVAFPMRLAYSAAKAAVISMTKVLAVEWARYGIRVNAVAPGITQTAMAKKSFDQGLLDVEACIQHTPLGRFAEPSEVADSVVYLASDRSRYVTGEVLVIDGGWTAYGFIPWSGEPESQ
ncbi:MAG TPA: SDR family NAD(P)-dependent oxidoreductase [Actinomycetota bacterium]|jgi:NAD(P)-dependent dehydrogenase (short-subunit alcohol dehydrogenase family)|nr:SDR family NAD(P)-dependent oxidoreductase [Actinomycetota bacterium]